MGRGEQLKARGGYEKGAATAACITHHTPVDKTDCFGRRNGRKETERLAHELWSLDLANGAVFLIFTDFSTELSVLKDNVEEGNI